jgi:hypothetical protein
MAPFSSANPDELAILSEAFESHCLSHNVVDEDARDHVARLVVLLFEGGAKTVAELKAGLIRLLAV